MAIQITEPITLSELLPLVKRLPKVEQDQLRKFLENDSTTWKAEWEQIRSQFRTAFAETPAEEVERDLTATLAEIRRERN